MDRKDNQALGWNFRQWSGELIAANIKNPQIQEIRETWRKRSREMIVANTSAQQHSPALGVWKIVITSHRRAYRTWSLVIWARGESEPMSKLWFIKRIKIVADSSGMVPCKVMFDKSLAIDETIAALQAPLWGSQ